MAKSKVVREKNTYRLTDRVTPSFSRPSTGPRSRFGVEVKAAEIEGGRGAIGNNEFRRMTDRGGKSSERSVTQAIERRRPRKEGKRGRPREVGMALWQVKASRNWFCSSNHRESECQNRHRRRRSTVAIPPRSRSSKELNVPSRGGKPAP